MRYCGQRCLPEYIIERHSSRLPGVWAISYAMCNVQFRTMHDPNCYELRKISIAKCASVKCYRPKLFPSFKISLELSFSRIIHVHMLQKLSETSAQHMQFFPWSAYLPDITSFEHVWNLVGRRPAHDPRLAASKGKLWLQMQAIWNQSYYQTYYHYNHTIKICLTPCHVV